MGQKVNPNTMRLGINKDWKSRYFPEDGDWKTRVVADKKIRNYFEPKFIQYGISSIEIERVSDKVRILINTAKPGAILGTGGENIKKINLDIKKIIKNKELKIKVEVKEVPKPELDATLVASEIVTALENRVSFRIAQKRAIRNVMRAGAKGIKTQVSGRLNGVDMARTEGYLEGQVPLQTIRNDIDFAKAEALTTYGIMGIKVWISKGEILEKGINRKPVASKPPPRTFNRRPYPNKEGGNRNVNTKEN